MRKDAYLAETARLGTFVSVEEFLTLHSKFSSVVDFKVGANMFLFRLGIKPMWEEMPNGATWSIKIKRSVKFDFDLAWKKTMLLCIGENLFVTHVAGCALNCRPGVIGISVWFESIPHPVDQFKILELLKTTLNLPVDTIMEFKEHSASIIDGSSSMRARRFSITSNS